MKIDKALELITADMKAGMESWGLPLIRDLIEMDSMDLKTLLLFSIILQKLIGAGRVTTVLSSAVMTAIAASTDENPGQLAAALNVGSDRIITVIKAVMAHDAESGSKEKCKNCEHGDCGNHPHNSN